MKNVDHIPENERQHFVKCEECGEWIDCRDLNQVIAHEEKHSGIKIEKEWETSRKIGEPTEYPNKNIKPLDLN